MTRDNDAAILGMGCLLALLIIMLSWGGMTVITYLGWNLVLAPIFDLPLLKFWQAFLLGLLVTFVGGCFRVVITRR